MSKPQAGVPNVIVKGVTGAQVTDWNHGVIHNVNRIASHNNQLNQVGNIHTGRAVLMLYSPREVPQHVLRSMKLNFNPNGVNVLASHPNLTAGLGRGGDLLRNRDVQKMVSPSERGLLMDTYNQSHQWSFVLIIDSDVALNLRDPMNVPFHNLQTNPRRQIMTGYCLGEPVAVGSIRMATQQAPLNQACCLQFTRSTEVRSTSHYTPTGGRTNLSIPMDEIIIPQNVDQFYNPAKQAALPDQHLLLNNPAAIRNSSVIDSSSVTTAIGNLVIEKAKPDERVIQSRNNSPIHVLKDIAYAVDSAVNNEKDPGIISGYSHRGYDGAVPSMDGFMSGFNSALQDTVYRSPLGVDASLPITLGQLKTVLPLLDVQIFQTPPNLNWEVTPQTIIRPDIQMSCLVSSTLNSLATCLGFAQLVFRYNSWVKDTATLKRGAWSFEVVHTIIPMNQVAQQSSIANLIAMLENDLWPVVHGMQGDFDVVVSFNMASETLVQLNYLDYRPLDGYYHNENPLAGYVTPTIGTADMVMHNAQQIQGMLSHVAVKNGFRDSRDVGVGSPNVPVNIPSPAVTNAVVRM